MCAAERRRSRTGTEVWPRLPEIPDAINCLGVAEAAVELQLAPRARADQRASQCCVVAFGGRLQGHCRSACKRRAPGAISFLDRMPRPVNGKIPRARRDRPHVSESRVAFAREGRL